MADLQRLQEFAASQGFDLTRPLIHEQVVRLAEYWLPDIRFYQEEKFHPISLDEVIIMVQDLFNQLPASARDEWRVPVLLRADANAGMIQKFDPPVIDIPDGFVQMGSFFLPAKRVLSNGNSVDQGFKHPDADTSAAVTHGASFTRSNEFFGGNVTLSGGAEATVGDPFLPRAKNDDGKPYITVLASFKNLLDTLKYELAVEETNSYPPDGLRGGFNIAGSLFNRVLPDAFPFPSDVQRDFLQALIAAVEAGEPIETVLKTLPHGWQLNRVAWDAVTRYAFLEYDFFYAYNDFDRVQTTVFENEHEGDAEGCCLVFDRNVINAAISNDPGSIRRAVPESIITSVHEEYQNADLFKSIPPPIPPINDPNYLPRKDVDLRVYIAWGSHATYLTPGDHDLVDFQDIFEYTLDNFPIPLLNLPVAFIAAIIGSIIDHFLDTEDKTSDDGIRSGPKDVVGEHPTAVDNRVLVMPMSSDEYIYEPEHENLLLRRAFAGKWGGHEGSIDYSSPFQAKTGRYFRKLVANL